LESSSIAIAPENKANAAGSNAINSITSSRETVSMGMGMELAEVAVAVAKRASERIPEEEGEEEKVGVFFSTEDKEEEQCDDGEGTESGESEGEGEAEVVQGATIPEHPIPEEEVVVGKFLSELSEAPVEVVPQRFIPVNNAENATTTETEHPTLLKGTMSANNNRQSVPLRLVTSQFLSGGAHPHAKRSKAAKQEEAVVQGIMAKHLATKARRRVSKAIRNSIIFQLVAYGCFLHTAFTLGSQYYDISLSVDFVAAIILAICDALLNRCNMEMICVDFMLDALVHLRLYNGYMEMDQDLTNLSVLFKFSDYVNKMFREGVEIARKAATTTQAAAAAERSKKKSMRTRLAKQMSLFRTGDVKPAPETNTM